jgi:hypothetical protein
MDVVRLVRSAEQQAAGKPIFTLILSYPTKELIFRTFN